MKMWAKMTTGLLVLAAVGGGTYFWWASGQNETADGDAVVIPSLTAPRVGGETAAPPARRTTQGWIDESTEIATIKPEGGRDADRPRVRPVSNRDDDLPEIDADAPSSGSSPSPRETSPPARRGDGEARQGHEVGDTRQQKPGLAVIPFEHQGNIPAGEAQAGVILADLLLSETDSDHFRLYERSQLKRLLAEQRFQESDLISDKDKAAKFGRLTGIRYLVVGSLSKLGSKYYLTARLVDCQTGEIGERGAVNFDSIDGASQKLPELVNLIGLREGAVRQGADVSVPGRPRAPLTTGTLMDAVNPDAEFKVTLSTNDGKTSYTKGENFAVKVTVERDCYVTLISVDSEGAATVLLPNAWEPGAFVRRNLGMLIPAEGAGFKFIVIPPYGETRIKAIATLKPLPVEGLTANRVATEKFVTYENGKAISVVADESGRRQTIPDLFKPSEWATAELTVDTFERQPREPVATPAPVVTPRPEPEAPVVTPRPTPVEAPVVQKPEPVRADSRDPVEVIQERWDTLVRTATSQKSLSSFGVSSDQRPMATGNVSGGGRTSTRASGNEELIVVRRKAGNGTKGIGGPAEITHEIVRIVGDTKSINPQQRAELIQRLRAEPDVVTVYPNLILDSYALPDVYLKSVHWGLENEIRPGVDIGWSRAAERIKSITPSIIGLVDGGMDVVDPRLGSSLWINTREIANNGVDDDGNGMIDDVHGYNFVLNNNQMYSPTAIFNHGTYCGSIMGAKVTGDLVDVVGILPQARIMVAVTSGFHEPKRDAPGHPTIAGLKALRYAMENGAKVINASWGSVVTAEELEAINRDPIWDELEQAGVIVVAATGNSYSDNDSVLVYPANLPRSNIISVMATDASGGIGRSYNPQSQQWEPFSNYGVRTVHLAAPGSQILGIPTANNTMMGPGTSFAAPMVTAAVSLVQGQHPTWDHRTVIRAILETTQPLAGLKGKCRTGGILNIDAALRWQP